MHSIDKENALNDVCDGAIRSGHIDMLKYAFDNGDFINDIFCKDVNILSWLIDNDQINPSAHICEQTAWAGNLECVQLLHHHQYPILTEKVFAKAVSSRNIEMIKWLHDLKCPATKKLPMQQ